MDYYILTGASRGIGEALTRKLIKPGNTIFAVSRTMNEDLVELAAGLNVPLFYFENDLSFREQAELFINEAFSHIQFSDHDRIALINNAGMLEPVAPLKSLDFDQAEKHLNLNFLTPLVLNSIFISKTSANNIPKVILNISSGASFIPYSGWAVYCSSKAALDMLTKVAGLEQSFEKYPVKIFALAPGIIETTMQETIRKSKEDMFPDRNSFIKLYEDGKLAKPEDVARIILDSIFDNSIHTGSVLTIEQLKEIGN
ncbi:MAG: SDR family NAD(P)-dependent oxidoreductase [Bacteroidales bacterium]